MKKLINSISELLIVLVFSLLTSCGGESKSHEGPLGTEATIADGYSSKLNELNEKMKGYVASNKLQDAISLQKEINELKEKAYKELGSFEKQNPKGKTVPFEQKGSKDSYEITEVKFVGYNTSGENIQSHFHATVKFSKEISLNEIKIDFVDASGNILLKDSFAIGVAKWNKKVAANTEETFFCNPNPFSKIYDLAKIVAQ